MSVRIIVVLVLALAAASNGVLSVLAFLRARHRSQALPFAALCAALAVYASGYALELTAGDLQRLYGALAYEYIGLGLIPPLWILLAREFSGTRTEPLVKGALFALSAVTIALVFTLPYHELYYRNLSVANVGGLSVISFDRAFWYWIQTAYLNVSFIYGTYQFGRAYLGCHTVLKRQAGMMLLGGILPWLAYLCYLLGLVPLGLEPGSIALSASAPLFAYGFFKFRLFELAPLARDAVFEQMRDAVIVVDEDGRIADLNQSALALPGMDREHAMRGIPVAAAMERVPGLLAAYRGEASSLAVPLVVGGALRRFDVSVSGLVDRRGARRGEAILLADTTERSALAEKLTEIANTDDLTGLSSRRHFFEVARVELARAIRYGRPIGLAILDLDRFKEINDRFGHLAGDQALKLFATLAGGCVRACDTIGRIGGDEFALLFPECDDETARVAAEKVRRRVAEGVFTVGDDVVNISASVGWAGSSGPDYPGLDELMGLADKRLYMNKETAHAGAAARMDDGTE